MSLFARHLWENDGTGGVVCPVCDIADMDRRSFVQNS